MEHISAMLHKYTKLYQMCPMSSMLNHLLELLW